MTGKIPWGRNPGLLEHKNIPLSSNREPVECWFVASSEAVSFGRFLIVFFSSKLPF